MDSSLIEGLENKLEKLLFTSEQKDDVKGLSQDAILDSLLMYVSDASDIAQHMRWLEIVGLKLPLLIVCKDSGFHQAYKKEQDSSDQSLNFVNTKKRGSKPSKGSSNQDHSSICGSPLKLDIIADLSVFDGESPVLPGTSKSVNQDFGLSLSKVRQLVSLYSNMVTDVSDQSKKKTNSPPAILAVCDGKNNRGVSTVSCMALLDQQNNVRGVKIVESVSKQAADNLTHMKLNPKFFSPHITCRARYDLLSNAVDSVQDTIQVELEWRNVSGLSLTLLHEPPMEASAVVKIRKSSGVLDSPLFSLYQELGILSSVVDGLATSEVNWIGTQDLPLVETVQNLLEELKIGSNVMAGRLGETTMGSFDEAAMIIELLEERKDLDFTDHLWKVLQGCTSYSDLIEAIKCIVAELRKGELQPFIHSYNSTMIGQMVKDSYRGQLRTPVLTGLEPLNYLAEIGVQKLMHDYVHIFLSKNLANLGMLEYYLKGNLDLEEKLLRLKKLHHALENVIMLSKNLKLPSESLSKICRQMLKHYEKKGIDEGYYFTFNVPRTQLGGVTEKFQPCEWRAEGMKMVGDVPELLVYHFTSDQPFYWLKTEPTGSQSEERSSSGGPSGGGDLDDNIYFLTIVRESVTMLC